MKIPKTFGEMKVKIEKAYKQVKAKGYRYVGVRFEDKQREIGESCNNSRHNPEREDGRLFPKFNDEGYKELEQFEGTSAWEMDSVDDHIGWYGERKVNEREKNWLYTCREHDELSLHCYVIAGNEVHNHPGRDYDEIIIKGAQVVEIIY